MKKKKSIRTKLLEVFLVIMVLVFVLNIYLSYNQSKAVRQIDSVYNNNIQLNDLSNTLEGMQSALYQYLNTKSSDQLESFYSYEQDYNNMIQQLNHQTMDDDNKLMEKNIYNMSLTYLERADSTIEAKRGRNVSKYNDDYGEAKKLYDYIQSCINSLNTSVFLESSNNYSLLRTSLTYLTGISMFLLLAALMIAFAWILVMTRNITKPLIQLADVANEIARGNMEVDFPIVETGDEITTVAKACNKMIDSIRVYIQKTKENYERESKLIENELIMKNELKEAQLKYLQAQINPHFLFNSLNAGAQLAMMEGAEKACLFIENMADFFRYNVRKIDKDTTLREELKLVDNYVYILNVRFSGDIHYRKKIDERLLDTLMPSMIIQPLIENAVNHGIRELDTEGCIELTVYNNNENVCITVADNGVGIEPEIAEKILRGESAHSNSGRDSAGIGMDNVINRLRRYYNMEHVMDIRRRESSGTEVILYLQKAGGGNKNDTDIDL
ncbi:sensor histidine kinase [Faecalicatena contorta]|uniref:sensor histidine kinase n=1 Tax=Faecalicatena contorta TaxID=39482 RepID=UPI001F314640|nr:histidine kinase [Faecalicatena contorta]MCF2683167.1 histidine kinase [Faecalicatena contorta]